MVNLFYSSVGARIRRLREAAGISQDELGTTAGINKDNIGRTERGRQNISLLTIGRIALALGVPPSALFEGVEADAASLERPLRKNARAALVPAAADGISETKPKARRRRISRVPAAG